MRKSLLAPALVLALALAACGAQPSARPCDGLPYTPNLRSGQYIKVVDGVGMRSDAAQSNYRCDNGRLVETAPVR